jgi:hypothetical protein
VPKLSATTCRHCGEPFTPAHEHHQFCAPRCRSAAFASRAVVLRVRVSARERHELRLAAARHGESVSGLVREALNRLYGVGDWPSTSSPTQPSGYNARRHT